MRYLGDQGKGGALPTDSPRGPWHSPLRLVSVVGGDHCPKLTGPTCFRQRHGGDHFTLAFDGTREQSEALQTSLGGWRWLRGLGREWWDGLQAWLL